MRALSSLLGVILVALAGHAQSDGQRRFDSYFEALPIFWQQVYRRGGETLYCGRKFSRSKSRAINIEHVYPMSWVMRGLKCGSRDACRSNNRRFNQIEADMHNFYPARKDINKIRGSLPFGTVRGEARKFGKCDFETDTRKRVAEPRPASRGNIARSMFYMKETYGLKIFPRQGRMLQQWNRVDPPDDLERQRNNRIEKIQGTRNRFIDKPLAADKLRF